MNALNNKHWYRLVQGVVTKYNNRKQTRIGMSPMEALLEENVDKVKENIKAKAQHTREYPDLEVGDMVKIIQKPGKYSEFKAGFVGWSKTTHQVESVEYENGYRLYNVSQRVKPLFRHELLKIDAAESAPKKRVIGKREHAALIQRKRAAQASD